MLSAPEAAAAAAIAIAILQPLLATAFFLSSVGYYSSTRQCPFEVAIAKKLF
jgi:hypothetical protein